MVIGIDEDVVASVVLIHFAGQKKNSTRNTKQVVGKMSLDKSLKFMKMIMESACVLRALFASPAPAIPSF